MMISVSRWIQVLGVVLIWMRCSCCGVEAARALSVTPSTKWYGDEGTWSAISIRVGTPQQWMDVMVSTVSSETWVVGATGCNPLDTTCIGTRVGEGGALFNSSRSSTWRPLGLFNLGADSQLGNSGQAQYGFDALTLGTTGVVLPSAIIGSFTGIGPVTGAQYVTGMFGLAITPGNFTTAVSTPAINALVERQDGIPSYTYGYTAGATYQQNGQPNSLTLGGYDANRLVPHNTSFSLNPSQQPQASISSISVVSTAGEHNNWTTPIPLLNSADRVSAVIDSSTPYLWLPESACDRFAAAFGLTYDDALDLYTFENNTSQRDTLSNSQLFFTFVLQDSSSTSTVNITLPYLAFDLQLTYPAIPNTKYDDANATAYYFPLRRALHVNQYTIGRAFLQEAYIITDYERHIFSIHQAVHIADPIGNTSIVSIERPSNPSTILTPPPTNKSRKPSIGVIVGIAVGVVVLLAGSLLSVVLFLSKRRKIQKQSSDSDYEKPIKSTSPRTIFDRILRRNDLRPGVLEANGSSTYATEISADATHERFELAAPLGPAELDSEVGTLEGTTERGASTVDSENLSAYERARRKLERQQIEAAQAQRVTDTYPVEKSEQDVSSAPHYRTSGTPTTQISDTALVSPVGPSSDGDISPHGTTSPVSPGFMETPVSPMIPPPTYNRFNFDPRNIVYAGRLPDNVQLPSFVPHIIGPDGRTVRAEPSDESGGTNDTLGSQYTEIENTMQMDIYGSGSGDTRLVSHASPASPTSNPSSGGTNIVSPIASGSSGSQGSSRGISSTMESDETPNGHARQGSDPWNSRRRLAGPDLVHIPQPAENRFSWEEERISGRDEGTS